MLRELSRQLRSRGHCSLLCRLPYRLPLLFSFPFIPSLEVHLGSSASALYCTASSASSRPRYAHQSSSRVVRQSPDLLPRALSQRLRLGLIFGCSGKIQLPSAGHRLTVPYLLLGAQKNPTSTHLARGRRLPHINLLPTSLSAAATVVRLDRPLERLFASPNEPTTRLLPGCYPYRTRQYRLGTTHPPRRTYLVPI